MKLIEELAKPFFEHASSSSAPGPAGAGYAPRVTRTFALAALHYEADGSRRGDEHGKYLAPKLTSRLKIGCDSS